MEVIGNYSSLKSTNFNNRQQLQKLLINICSLLSALFAIIVSLLIITYVCINYFLKNNFKKTQNVPLLLTCNTCLAIICSSSTLTLMMLSTISGDLNIPILQWIPFWGCYVRGYLHFVFINSIYLSYVLQAGFRLCRIVFKKYKCLRTIYSFSYYIAAQWIASFLLIIPILVARKGYSSLIVYLPQEFYCQVPMTSIRGIVFSILSVYFIPLCCIGIIYLRIIIHIRHKSSRFALVILSLQRKNKRDTMIIKRICVVMIVLLLLGIPSCSFVIAFIITDHLHWASYRVGWMTISISFALISLSSLYVTPQIYKPMRNMINRSKRNQGFRSNNSSSTTNYVDKQKKTESFLHKQNMTDSSQSAN